MITSGPNLGLLINAATGDQHDIAFRKFLRAVDALVLLMVKSRTLTAPPGSPANGDRYVVGPAPTGAWTGEANAVAVWTTDDPASPLGDWEFHTPAEGWLAWSQADAAPYVFHAGAWGAFAAAAVSSVAGRTGAIVLAEADVTNLATDLAATEKTAHKGVASGYASLDGTGHVPLAQIPAGISGGLTFKGTWDASANSPALANGVGTNGDLYKVATAGTTALDGNAVWNVGDILVFDGTAWEKIDNYEAVTTVAGRTGAIVLAEADVTGLVADLATLTSSLSAEATARTTGDTSTLATAGAAAAAMVATETTRATTAEALLAPKASPALTGNPTAPTQAALDNSTKIGTTAYADAAVAAEATARGTAVTAEATARTNADALLAPKASPVFTGTPTAPTPAALDNSTTLSTTAYADAAVAVEVAARIAAVSAIAPVTNPVFTGSLGLDNPTAATSTIAQSSPILKISGRFWNGSASATDGWTVQDVLTNGTMGASQLQFAHSGTSGNPSILLPATTTTPVDNTQGILFANGFALSTDATGAGNLYFNAPGNSTFWFNSLASGIFLKPSNSGSCVIGTSLAGNFLTLQSNITAQTTAALGFGLVVANNSSFVGTAASIQGLAIFSGTFAPTSGSTHFDGLVVSPTINQTSTSTGNYTALRVSVAETSLKGAGNLLLDLQGGTAGTTSRFNVDNAGNTTLINPTAATVTVPQNSPILKLSGQYWTGAASAADSWTLQSVLVAGANGASRLTFGHTGTTGDLQVLFPPGSVTNPGLGTAAFPGTGFQLSAATWYFATSGAYSLALQATGVLLGSAKLFSWSSNANPAAAVADSGLSRIAAASLAVGNGTAGDFSGSLKLTTVQVAASAGAPTSAGTAGTAGQIIMFGGLVYFCSVTGAAGSATWNKLNMTAV